MNNISIVFSVLHFVRHQFESRKINSPLAHLICRIIPARCPFERKIRVFKHTVISIPPLCKLNPFYEQLVALRFKSLTYLAEKCGEDVTLYC
ncbi:MAG: nitrogenase [Pleurocapsa sp. SU_5_0]|nr:nitrogenase [Pleurocapsa sp. SU_5_0]NJO96782.1 nitrogenase [Pleurocapsa sp. CRU_1_2]NJR45763.1 nitrogenase [Hyellaceae cyanobacterium CSU_1_1]